ncbi:hypothetical protein BGZ95_011813 [Linnemannia exigua]|uniref:Uncharacterized protein n=1 Tax=Linnemannia exigua TaxID=604196 RepID=A0AAD4D9F4_9FUNG|nr:hypothetical protein BGZ95_011813 [Linnemannia exigua]
MGTLQKTGDLPCLKTSCHGDQQHYYDNDHDMNERSNSETDSEEEKGHSHKAITNSGSAPHLFDTTGTAKGSLAEEASSSIVDFYNHPSNHEFPNGNVVETIQLLPSDQDFRSKSTGWALLTLQSFKALVKKNCDVKVHLHAGILKAQSCTFQTLLTLNKKLDYHIDSDNEERVDIAEKICFGVYKCPKCEFSQRPRLPKTGKNRNSIPRPPVGKCRTHLGNLEWKRCSASAVIVCYYGRMKTEIHHRGTHNHPKPPQMRVDILAWRELTARVNATPYDTAGKTKISSNTQKSPRKIHVALANIDRLSNDV